MAWHKGSCHCGAVTFRVEAPRDVEIHACNCSICNMLGFLHLIVPKERFELLTGEDAMTDYRFGTGVAQHRFCRICGVKAFYIPRSNPNGVSVNFRCLDHSGFEKVEIEPFDGQNWEENAHKLSHLSQR